MPSVYAFELQRVWEAAGMANRRRKGEEPKEEDQEAKDPHCNIGRCEPKKRWPGASLNVIHLGPFLQTVWKGSVVSIFFGRPE